MIWIGPARHLRPPLRPGRQHVQVMTRQRGSVLAPVVHPAHVARGKVVGSSLFSLSRSTGASTCMTATTSAGFRRRDTAGWLSSGCNGRQCIHRRSVRTTTAPASANRRRAQAVRASASRYDPCPADGECPEPAVGRQVLQRQRSGKSGALQPARCRTGTSPWRRPRPSTCTRPGQRTSSVFGRTVEPRRRTRTATSRHTPSPSGMVLRLHVPSSIEAAPSLRDAAPGIHAERARATVCVGRPDR